MLVSGPPTATVLIVADFPSQLDMARNLPLADQAGSEFDRMLMEAGIMRTSCYVMTLSTQTPPAYDPYSWVDTRKSPRDKTFVQWHDLWAHKSLPEGETRVLERIAMIKPSVVITLGNAALRALTPHWSAKSYRGSLLQGEISGHKFKIIPTLHPRTVLQDWSLRATVVQDLRRAQGESLTGGVVNVPKKEFVIRPNFEQVILFLRGMLERMDKGEELRISSDIETRAGHIACLGYALSATEAISIPLMCVEREDGYWDLDQEVAIWKLVRKVHLHPNARVFGQNFLYDAQYFYRWLFIDGKIWFDTMIFQHCLFPGTPKSLDYLASLYCKHYVFWKDDGKEWAASKMGENQLWRYNCEDCCYTYEIMEAQYPMLEKDARLRSVWEFQQNVAVPRVFAAMNRGVRADLTNKARLSKELETEIATRQKWLHFVAEQPLNIKSPKQMQSFFYGELNFKPIISRKTHSPTLDDKALESLAVKEPAIRPVVRVIQELRSLSVFKSTFVEAKLDRDQRIRSSYNITGTETFRLSSSENAFWTGLNLQNIPKGSEDSDDPKALRLPNVRKLFLPDKGMMMFDMDLNRADLEVVVAEAEDEEMFIAMRSGIDMHSWNAKELFGLSCPIGEVKVHFNDKRQLAKAWVHGTNYGGGPRTMAKTCGITVHEAEKLRARWFQMHPGIERWHRRQEHLLKTRRMAENRFGYRYTFFDRIDAALPEALAWVPQSTVACVINRAWDQIMTRIPQVEILIQVHDSLVGQFPARMEAEIVPQILEAAKVVIPYDKPLVIEAGIATSTVSWGDCK